MLTVVEANMISYDDEANELWFYDGENVYTTELAKSYALVRIKEAYNEGKIDLTSHIFKTIDG